MCPTWNHTTLLSSCRKFYTGSAHCPFNGWGDRGLPRAGTCLSLKRLGWSAPCYLISKSCLYPHALRVYRTFKMPPLFFFVVGLFFSSLFIVFSSSEVKLLPWLSVALDHVVEVVRGGWSPESAWTGNLHPQSGPGLWKGRLAWYSSLLLFWNSQRFWPWNSPPLSHYFIMV